MISRAWTIAIVLFLLVVVALKPWKKKSAGGSNVSPGPAGSSAPVATKDACLLENSVPDFGDAVDVSAPPLEFAQFSPEDRDELQVLLGPGLTLRTDANDPPALLVATAAPDIDLAPYMEKFYKWVKENKAFSVPNGYVGAVFTSTGGDGRMIIATAPYVYEKRPVVENTSGEPTLYMIDKRFFGAKCP